MPHDGFERRPDGSEMAIERDLAAEAELPTNPRYMARRDLLGRRRPPWWFGLAMVAGMLLIGLLLAVAFWDG